MTRPVASGDRVGERIAVYVCTGDGGHQGPIGSVLIDVCLYIGECRCLIDIIDADGQRCGVCKLCVSDLDRE